MEPRIGTRNVKSQIFKGIIVFFAFVIALPLIIILLYIIKQGIGQVNWTFLTHTPAPVGETGGGIINALVGTFILVLVAAVVAIPVGMAAGIYLSENPRTKLAYYTGLCVDILQAIPSIVVGIGSEGGFFSTLVLFPMAGNSENGFFIGGRAFTSKGLSIL